MKHLPVIGLVAALAAASVPALAQDAPPTPSAAMRQQFQQMHTQMEQIHSAERSQILGALSPAHKTLLANVVGQLATSVNPNFDAAAQQLDNALSSGEKTAILNAAQNARTKQRALMQSMRSQMPGGPQGMGPGGMMEHHGTPPSGMAGARRAPDAGRILLGLSMPHGEMGMHYGGFRR